MPFEPKTFTFVRNLIISYWCMHKLMEFLPLKRFKTVDGGHLGFGSHIGKRKFASHSNMKEHIQKHLCAKFHACMIKHTHHPGISTILLDYLDQLLKVMGTHNDFRSLAETQVKSPQHLKLDTSLLRHRDRQLFYNMYRK